MSQKRIASSMVSSGATSQERDSPGKGHAVYRPHGLCLVG